MNTENDNVLIGLRAIRVIIDKLIAIREKEIEAYKQTGFNPDDTTRKEEN